MSNRPTIRGKFLWIGDRKFIAKAVTYGTFMANSDGDLFPERNIVRRDFELMKSAGVNTIRTYTLPPDWLLEEAQNCDIWVVAGIFWEGRQCIFDNRIEKTRIRRLIDDGIKSRRGHDSVLMWCIGNEIPPDVIRWHGAHNVEKFLRELYDVAKQADPDGIITYASYPPTEYLDISFFDVASYNVYLLREVEYRSYLARLQMLAGDKPLFLAETGSDSLRDSLEEQARIVEWQVRGALEKGLCGVAMFSWTDEWAVGGKDIEDWQFGVVDGERRPKPALAALSKLYRSDLCSILPDQPRISVVIAAYNAESTIEECLESTSRLIYKNYEVIVVDDGSSDRTAEIASRYPVELIRLGRSGLSAARNAGIEAATGEIVAFTDADCVVDPDWLFYLAAKYSEGRAAAVGGPNIMPENDGWYAQCIDKCPGMPRHVLLAPEISEHIPGCNMSFRREELVRIGMFDPVYAAAGDDVDVCWRLEDEGREIAFAHGAVVWHHRRNSVRAYLRQQKGYGRAETLLSRKHPLKFNSLGGIRWRGSVYDSLRRLVRSKSKVFQGSFGAGQFQSIYYPHWAGWLYIATTPEWYAVGIASLLLAFLLALLGLHGWQAPLVVGALLAVATVGVSTGAAIAAELPRNTCAWDRFARRSVIALLHLLQPIYRARGRMFVRQKTEPVEDVRRHAPAESRPTDRYWAQWIDRPAVLESIMSAIRSENFYVDSGTGWEDWDLRVDSGWLSSAKIVTAVEDQTILRHIIMTWPNPVMWLPLAVVVSAVYMALSPAASLMVNIPLLAGTMVYARRESGKFELKLRRIIDRVLRNEGFVPLEPSRKRGSGNNRISRKDY